MGSFKLRKAGQKQAKLRLDIYNNNKTPWIIWELGGGPPKETKNKQPQQQERSKIAENLENKYE